MFFFIDFGFSKPLIDIEIKFSLGCLYKILTIISYRYLIKDIIINLFEPNLGKNQVKWEIDPYIENDEYLPDILKFNMAAMLIIFMWTVY